MSTKKIAIAALAFAAIGAGFAVYKYLYNGDSNPGDLAAVIPADAYMAAYISTEPEAWAKLQKFGTPEAQSIVTKQLTQTQQSFLTQTKMDFNKDIQPWLGSTMVAILPDTGGQNAKPQLLIAVGIKDKLKASDFANRLKAQSKEPSKKLNYKGIEITDTGKGSGETFSAILNDRLVVSPQQHTLELAIDTAQGQPSLASKAGSDWFKADTLQLKQPIAAFYIPDYSQAIQQFFKAGNQPIPLDAATLAQLKKIQSFGGGIAIDDGGIRMKLIAKTDGTTLNLPATSAQSISNFPADTLMVVGGTGLNQVWTEIDKILKTQPQTQQSLTQVRQSFTQSTQLDLDKDVFAWMSGDYTLGVMPVSTGMMAQVGVGGALTIDSNDRAVTDNTMTKLTNLAKGYGMSVEQRQVGTSKIVDVKAPAGQGTMFSYGWLSDKSLVLAMGDGLVDKIVTHSGESLDRHPNFTAAFGNMPDQKQSYAYYDIENIFSLFDRKMGASMGKGIPADVNALITSVKGLGMSSTQPDQNTSQVEILLTLKSASNK